MKINVRSKGYITINKEELLTFKDVKLCKEDFTGRKEKRFMAINSRFENCRFEKMKLEQTSFGGGGMQSEYIDCSFDNSKIIAIAPGCARFIRCSFRNVVIDNFFGHNVEFIDCIFSGKLKKVVFWGSVNKDSRERLGREFNEFYGNDFSEADFDDVGFRGGIDLSKQKLPVGKGYIYLSHASEMVSKTKQTVMKWPDEKLKEEGLFFIELLERKIKSGQKQIFLRVEDYKEGIILQDDIFLLLQNITDNK